MTHDLDCSKQHEQITQSIAKLTEKLDKHQEQLREHVDEAHADVMSKREIMASLSAITDTLAGPVNVLSRERDQHRGMAHKVDVLWRQSQNGGLRTKLAPIDRRGLWGLIVAVVIDAGIRIFG